MKFEWDRDCLIKYPLYDDYHRRFNVIESVMDDIQKYSCALLRIGAAILLNALDYATEKEEKRGTRG